MTWKRLRFERRDIGYMYIGGKEWIGLDKTVMTNPDCRIL